MEGWLVAAAVALVFVALMRRLARRRRESGKTPGRSTQAWDDRGGSGN